MRLEGRKAVVFQRLIEHLTHGFDHVEIRHQAGRDILDLLGADYFASYIWDPDNHLFDDRVAINMDDANLKNYERYYQYRDPITFKLQKRRTATAVNQIMPQRELLRTEFYNDFLRRDGLYYGVNLYAYDGTTNIGDMRIWRRQGRDNFDQADLTLLDAIRPVFTNALRNIRDYRALQRKLDRAHHAPRLPTAADLIGDLGLTQREARIALGVLEGQGDAAIAVELGIAVSTVRTHLKNSYLKLGVHSRTALINRLIAGRH
jgi:DNA-binding CsgD family transcriptional regulator